MSAHIAIRCDECGKTEYGESLGLYEDLRADIAKEGWEFFSTTMMELCPFCAARQKAKDQAEAANAGA